MIPANFFKNLLPEKPAKAFWLSFLLCLIVGLAIIWVITPLTGIGKAFGPGHDGYIELARSIVNGYGYVFQADGQAVFHRPPFYPFLLIPISLLPAPLERTGLVILQSLMVGCIGAIIFSIAKKLFSPKTAKIAIALFLMYPWVYWHAKNPMTPIVQGLLYILFIALLGRELLSDSQQKRLWTRRFALGISAGVLALTHGAMLPVVAMMMLLLFIASVFRKDFRKARTAVFSVVIIFCIVAPWTYRNWVVFHRFIPVVRGSGLAYFNGVSHWGFSPAETLHEGESYIDASLRLTAIGGTEEEQTHFKGLKNLELDDQANQKMVEHIRENPLRFIKLIFLNATEYYFPTAVYPFLANKHFSLEALALTLFHVILWTLAFAGTYLNWKNNKTILPNMLLFSAILFYAVWYFPFATFIGHWLYSFGTIPLLVIISASAFEKRKS